MNSCGLVHERYGAQDWLHRSLVEPADDEKQIYVWSDSLVAFKALLKPSTLSNMIWKFMQTSEKMVM